MISYTRMFGSPWKRDVETPLAAAGCADAAGIADRPIPRLRARHHSLDSARRRAIGAVPRRPAIVAFWHERLPLMPALMRVARKEVCDVRVCALVSRHTDGRFLGALLQ